VGGTVGDDLQGNLLEPRGTLPKGKGDGRLSTEGFSGRDCRRTKAFRERKKAGKRHTSEQATFKKRPGHPREKENGPKWGIWEKT